MWPVGGQIGQPLGEIGSMNPAANLEARPPAVNVRASTSAAFWGGKGPPPHIAAIASLPRGAPVHHLKGRDNFRAKGIAADIQRQNLGGAGGHPSAMLPSFGGAPAPQQGGGISSRSSKGGALNTAPSTHGSKADEGKGVGGQRLFDMFGGSRTAGGQAGPGSGWGGTRGGGGRPGGSGPY